MKQEKLIEKIIKAANKISATRKEIASYIHLNKEYIQQQADERNISFDDMVEHIKKKLMPDDKRKTNNSDSSENKR